MRPRVELELQHLLLLDCTSQTTYHFFQIIQLKCIPPLAFLLWSAFCQLLTQVRNLSAVERTNTCLGTLVPFKKMRKKCVWGYIWFFFKENVLDLFINLYWTSNLNSKINILCILNYIGEFQWGGATDKSFKSLVPYCCFCWVIFSFLSFLYLTTTKSCYCRRIRRNSSYGRSP